MTATLRAGAERWHLAPGVPPELLLGPRGLRLPEWLASGQAVAIKQRPRRGVWRVTLPGLDFYLKHDHPNGAAGWLRGFLRPSTAKAEYAKGLAVSARHVSTPMPLAFGENCLVSGGSCLLTRTVPDALPLDVFLERILSTQTATRQTRLRQVLARALGEFLARMHEAGIAHDDLHPGNLLLQLDDAAPRLWLIDLHAARLGAPLNRRASKNSLAILNRWFMLRSDRTDRLRCWQAYRAARTTLTGNLPQPRDVEHATLASNLRFWKVRDRRCLGSNRYFRRVHRGAVRAHVVAHFPREALEPFLTDPDAPFRTREVRVLKDSRSSTVVEMHLPGWDAPVICKRFAVTAWTDPWAALARPIAALRSWIMGHGLLTRYLPTPRPLALLIRVRRGLPREGYLLTEKVPDAVDLADYVERCAGRRAVLRDLIGRVARLVRTMHQRHVSHRDLKAPNLLLSAGPDAWTLSDIFFVDLVGVRPYRKLTRARRLQNLARLHASFRRHPALTRTDKLRFLRAYLAWGLHGRLGWKRWWRQIEHLTEAKARRNLRNGRPLK